MKDKNYSNDTKDSVRDRMNKTHELHMKATKEAQEALKKMREKKHNK